MHKKEAKRNLRLLNILSFLFGFRTFEGLMAVYFASITGSLASAMSVLVLIGISASIFEIPTGILSDKIGRKKTILLSDVSITIAILAYLIAESTSTLMIGTIMWGLSYSLRSGTLSAFVYENLVMQKRVHEFKKVEGHRRSLDRYSLVISGLLGTIIIYFFGIKPAILVTLLIFIVGLALSLKLKDIPRSEKAKSGNIYSELKKAWNFFKKSKSLRNISLGRIISRGGGNVEYRFRALLFSSIMPDWLVNLLGLLNNFLSGLSMKLAHLNIKRFGFTKSLVGGEIIEKISNIVLTIINTIPGFFIMNSIGSVVFGSREVATEDLLQEKYDKSQRATMGSIVSLGSSLLYGALGILIGLWADNFGVINTMLMLQPILLLSSFFFYKGTKPANK